MTGLRLVSTIALSLCLLPGCAGDDDGGDEGSTPTTGNTTTGGEDPTSGGAASSSEGGNEDDSSSGGGAESTDEGMMDSTSAGSTGSGMTCDPVVPGEFNACVDDMGNVDNTLCNWVGNPDFTGMVSCLTSSKVETANVCMIAGCEDVCDCFAPPATGDAEVVCADILADGGTACALACDQGQTCPDGMECLSGLCFHNPA